MADREQTNLQAAFDFARDTLRSLVLINGGAVVALMTFYGSGRPFADGSFYGLLGFTLGVAFAVGSSLTAYLAQLHYGRSVPDERRGGRALATAIILAFGSLGLFVFGAVATGLALES